MAVLANPSCDRHEAGTRQLRRPWYFSWALGGRSSRRGSAKHGGEDRAEPSGCRQGRNCVCLHSNVIFPACLSRVVRQYELAPDG